MAWIEVHQSLFTHRKTFIAAERLGLPEVYVAGHLIALWTWALDNAPDGVLPQSERIIARGAQYTGDAHEFVEVLRMSGFLTDTWKIHDWGDYAGKLIERRKRNTEAVRAHRNRQGRLTARFRNDDVSVTSEATVPNTTEHNTTEQDQDTGAAPPAALQAEGAQPKAVPKPKKRSEELYETLTDELGQPATESERGVYRRAVRELCAVGAKPDEIRLRAGRYRTTWPNVELTPAALLKHWSRFAEARPAAGNGRASPPLNRVQQREQQILAEREEALRRINGRSEHN